MKKTIYIIIFFTTIGFIFSFFPSLIVGVSFIKLIIRTIFSTIIMSIFGIILAIFIDKNISIDTFDNNVAINIKKKEENPENSNLNFEDYLRSNFEDNKIDKEDIVEKSKLEEDVKEEEEDINYSSIFSSLEKQENQEDIIDESNNFRSFEYKNFPDKDEITSLEGEVKENKVIIDNNINLNEPKIIHSDDDLKEVSIGDSEKTLISSTSSSSIVNSDIESIDQDYIYLKNKKKIENKPEKIAKVIKNMMMEDKED
ncbi:MAG: hypothetical protein N3A58_05565 [Spirochaetes bacterium]|nr:hypothetical protein [Spirochaetota bacterium]